MSAHILTGTLGAEILFGMKKALVTITGSASYDAGGSLIDLSSIFPSKVYGAKVVAVSPHGSDIYAVNFIRGAGDGPALGKLKVRDLTASSDAEASGDLHTTTWTLEVAGV